MASVLYKLSWLYELGLMSKCGLGLKIGENGNLDYGKACFNFCYHLLLK